jgi:hypothetical protein
VERGENFVGYIVFARYIVAITRLAPDSCIVCAGSYFIRRASIMITLVCTIGAFSSPSNAQPSEVPGSDEAVRPIEVIHTAFASAEIPPVGSLMKVALSLSNTVDIETKVRLIGTKDGRFIDIAFPRGALDSSDRPTFSIEIPSPMAMMTYQFVVHQKDGSLSSSRKFTIKRRCLQTFAINVQDDKRTTAFRREVASLIAQAHMLERDNKSLETSLKVLEEIKSSLSR